MAGELDSDTIAKAYAGWAPVYDLVFGAVFDAGRRASIAAAERIGGRILDVGVGTGISLADYSRRNRIVGVDYSEPMLRKAHERVVRQKLSHVEVLAVMDAQRLGFPDAAFDVVVAQYVITAVPSPEATLDEFVRVIKPGGEIVCSTTCRGRPVVRDFEPCPRSRAELSWRPGFEWARLARWAERSRCASSSAAPCRRSGCSRSSAWPRRARGHLGPAAG